VCLGQLSTVLRVFLPVIFLHLPCPFLCPPSRPFPSVSALLSCPVKSCFFSQLRGCSLRLLFFLPYLVWVTHHVRRPPRPASHTSNSQPWEPFERGSGHFPLFFSPSFCFPPLFPLPSPPLRPWCGPRPPGIRKPTCRAVFFSRGFFDDSKPVGVPFTFPLCPFSPKSFFLRSGSAWFHDR